MAAPARKGGGPPGELGRKPAGARSDDEELHRAVGSHGTRAPQLNECMGNISLNLGEDITDPRIELSDQVGGRVIQWFVEGYPHVPQVSDAARNAVALFTGGMQEPELVVDVHVVGGGE